MVLARMSLLPVETEEEWRRRKELQTLRRMEAKRTRSENQRSTKENNISFCREERESGMGLSLKRKLDLERKNSGQPGKLNLDPRVVVAAAGMKGKSAFFGSLEGLLMAHHQQQQQQQGNSQGDCSSGVSELESKTTNQGSGSTHPTQERGSQDPPLGLNKQPESSDNNMKEVAAVGGIECMPCVFTIGDGPNGRKVEGIL